MLLSHRSQVPQVVEIAFKLERIRMDRVLGVLSHSGEAIIPLTPPG